MKKSLIYIIIALIIIVVVFLVYLLARRYMGTVNSNNTDIRGQIIIRKTNKSNMQLALIDTQTTSINYHGDDDIAGEPFFSAISNKIYLLGYDELFEYDINTDKITSLCDLDVENHQNDDKTWDDQYNGYWEKPQFNSVANVISFVNRHNRGLYLFNIEAKSLVKIPNAKVGINSMMHSITKDGENLIYATEDFQIVSLNLKTGEQTRLGEGSNPVLSKNDTLLAYHIVPSTNVLYVKDLQVNKIWELKMPSHYIRHYKFSPDGKYLAVLYGEDLYGKIQLSVFDYQEGKLTKTLVNNFTMHFGNSFDWE